MPFFKKSISICLIVGLLTDIGCLPIMGGATVHASMNTSENNAENTTRPSSTVATGGEEYKPKRALGSISQKKEIAASNRPCATPASTGASGRLQLKNSEDDYDFDDDDRSSPDAVVGNGSKDTRALLDAALEFLELAQQYREKKDLDGAISALDQAYSTVLQATGSDNPDYIQEKEDLRFMICKRMLEVYTSRSMGVRGTHNEIPVAMNNFVQDEINSFSGAEKEFFMAAYKRSGRYRSKIVKALKEAGLPEELSWLPLIESGFKSSALSSARALGLWQFIPSTGYKFGLKRDEWVDERMDADKSTRAAIAYLQELHQLFGDWATVLAAYNCGEARVLKVIRGQNINYLDNFWDLFRNLPRETARYVPRFMAALQIINNPQKYGFDFEQLDAPFDYEITSIEKQMRLDDIASSLEVPVETLASINSELRYKTTPPTPYALRVPTGKTNILAAKLDSIPTYKPVERPWDKSLCRRIDRFAYRKANGSGKESPVYHRVRKGETLAAIAKKYRTTSRSIAKANNIRRGRTINAGQTLKIPMKANNLDAARVLSASSNDERSSRKTKTIYHKVRKGDTLYRVAKQYSVDVKDIMRLNNLKSPSIHSGQKLMIRGEAKTQDVAATEKDVTKTYLVRNGDSPYNIASRHNMRLERFLNLNSMSEGAMLYPGQAVRIETGKHE